jgi:uncharacterized protein (DUF2147 family)
MQRNVALAGALFACVGGAFAQTDTPIGTWQTIDDHTHQPKALVRITQDESGELSGKVINGPNPDKRCTSCTDARKDQLILGMTIITGMRKDGDSWDGGQILDPDIGKLYKCKLHTEDGGRRLVVRGYIGVSLLGRSQTWIRQN